MVLSTIQPNWIVVLTKSCPTIRPYAKNVASQTGLSGPTVTNGAQPLVSVRSSLMKDTQNLTVQLDQPSMILLSSPEWVI